MSMSNVLRTRVLTTAVLSFLIAASANAAGMKTYRGKVMKIVDGDTIRFLPDGAKAGTKSWSIRMVHTDTAETHLPSPDGVVTQGYWGDKGQEKLASFLKVGETVEIDSTGTDKYGRVLGHVFKRGNVDVNLAMVKSGWASLYVICDEESCDMDPDYRAACDAAMDAGRGIFNPKKRLPQLKFIFRSIHQRRPLAKPVGNVQTKEFYAPKDYAKVPLCDRVFFMTEADAIHEGFKRARAR